MNFERWEAIGLQHFQEVKNQKWHFFSFNIEQWNQVPPEQETQEGGEGVDRDHEQNPDNPPLLGRVSVIS